MAFYHWTLEDNKKVSFDSDINPKQLSIDCNGRLILNVFSDARKRVQIYPYSLNELSLPNLKKMIGLMDVNLHHTWKKILKEDKNWQDYLNEIPLREYIEQNKKEFKNLLFDERTGLIKQVELVNVDLLETKEFPEALK